MFNPSQFPCSYLNLSRLGARISIAFAVSSMIALPSVAQVTVNQSVEKALTTSPEVQIRSRNYQAASADQDIGRAAYRPTLDVQAGTGWERRTPPTTDPQSYSRPTASVQLRQVLWDGFAAINEVNRLGFNRLAKFYEFASVADQTALEAARAHMDVRRYTELSELAHDNWVIHKETHDQIEERAKAGVGRRVDLELATGRLALATSNWVIENSNLHDVSARYARVVGEAPKNLTSQTPNVASFLPIGGNGGNDFVRNAIAENPDFLASVSNVRAAKYQILARRAAYGPTIEARASGNWDKNLSGVPGTFNTSNAGIYLNYNLFRGLGDVNRVRQAKELEFAAEDTRDKVCRDVRQQTVIAYNDVRKLIEQLQYLDQHVLSLDKARVAYRQQFDIGQRTLLDVLDIENELFQARRAVVNARYDQHIAEYRTLTQASRILPAFGLAPTQKNLPDDGDYKEMLQDALIRCDAMMTEAPAMDMAASLTNRTPLPVAPATPTPGAVATAPATLNAVPAPNTVPNSCEETVKAWAIAWSTTNLNTYLGFYSSKFQPESRADIANWRGSRAQRLARKQIAVEVESLSCKRLANGNYEASFQQRYRSSEYNDDVQKTLVLAPENGMLKIIRESSIPKTSSAN